MIGGGEQRFGGCDLDDASQIHHNHAIRQMPHDSKIVADEQIRQLKLIAQIHEQIQHLRLDRHVERGHCLVAHQKLGLHRQCARDSDARALAAGKLVRIAAHVGRVESDTLQ